MRRDLMREGLQNAAGVKSPIESMMATALYYLIGLDMFERSGHAHEPVAPMCAVVLQQKIGKYSADIALICQDSNIVVECDGHEFHEKTKEQAAHDKARDRYMTSVGWTVLRFTGSEIWADPFSCAEEAIGMVKAAQDLAACTDAKSVLHIGGCRH